MTVDDTTATLGAMQYHEATRHSPDSIRLHPGAMDFSNQPIPYKVYRDLPQRLLLEPMSDAVMAAIQAVAAAAVPDGEGREPDAADLRRLLHNANGIARILRRGVREFVFRAAACTGALYEIELYVICGDLSGLSAGVYHYSPKDEVLTVLRTGDYRHVLLDATAGDDHVRYAPVSVVATGTYWRNAWKYGARTYRHLGWDNGMIMANLLATSAALRLPARILTAFVDVTVNRLLALDDRREVALTVVPIGWRAVPAPAAPDCPILHPDTEPLSPRGDVDFPLMRAVHAASALGTPGTVADWLKHVGQASTAMEGVPDPLPASAQSRSTVDGVIAQRGSTRQFSRAPLTQEQLSTLLRETTLPIPGDWHSGGRLNELYLIVHAVAGLPAGAYVYQGDGLRLLMAGDFRAEAGFLDLDQDLAADAAVNVYFMANLPVLLDRLGDRGYRAVQLEAGILGGRMYLCSYALGFGATGLTFFDDAVTEFFSPHAARKSPIFLMAFGHKR